MTVSGGGAAASWLGRLRRRGNRLAQRVLGKRLFCLLRWGRANLNTIAYWDAVYAREGQSDMRLYRNLHQAIVGALPPGARVLDAGCGPGHLMEACRGAGRRVVGLDFSLKAIQICRQRDLPGCVAALPDLPFPDGSFDAVILSEVIEHLSDPHDALRAAARLLRPGGRLIVTVPDRPDGLGDACVEHVHTFSADSLCRLLAAIPGLACEVPIAAVADDIEQPTGAVWHLERLIAVATAQPEVSRNG